MSCCTPVVRLLYALLYALLRTAYIKIRTESAFRVQAVRRSPSLRIAGSRTSGVNPGESSAINADEAPTSPCCIRALSPWHFRNMCMRCMLAYKVHVLRTLLGMFCGAHSRAETCRCGAFRVGRCECCGWG
jgi:hypothetical protein